MADPSVHPARLPSALATPAELCASLGARLRTHRLAQAITQEALAARAGISTGALKKLEKDGQANALTLVRVAQALGLASQFDALFHYDTQASIAQMERAQAVLQRQRAPRRRP